MGSPSAEGSSPVMPCVWTRGVRTSPLAPLVSPRRVLQIATAPPVTWTAPFHPGSLSLACVVFSASLPLLRQARALASQRLRPSDSAQRSASFSTTPSSSWLRLPSLGKPHCLLRRELTSPELRHGHRRRGQGSVVRHFTSFLSKKLR